MLDISSKHRVLTIRSAPPHGPVDTELAGIMRALDAHPDAAVVLAGSGSHWLVPPRPEGDEESVILGQLMESLPDRHMPVVAVIDAPATGAAFALALLCDLRLGTAGVRIGPADPATITAGLAARIAAVAGVSLATRLCLLSEVIAIGAPGTEQLVTPTPSPVDEAAAAVSEQLERSAPLALEAVRTLLDAATGLPFPAGIALEADLACLLLPTEDRREGLRAFRERRAPVFNGW